MRDALEIVPRIVMPQTEGHLKILILEDIPADTELVLSELKEADLHYEVSICRTEEQFNEQTKAFRPDIILTPYSLSYTNAVKAYKRSRNEGCTAPFILLAQDLSEDIAIELLKTGIEDYVLRSTLKRLPIAIKKAMSKDRTQRELELNRDMVKASKASLINMVRNMPMAVAMFDTEMRYIVVSELWLETEGFSEKELIGRSHYDMVPHLPDHWKAIHRECLKGATRSMECEQITRPDGSEPYIRWKINPWYSPDGKIGGIVLFTEDITDKVLAEEEIRSKERSLSMAQDVGNVGSFELDLETKALTWSDQMYRIFGIEKREVTYHNVDEFIHKDDLERFREQTESRALTGLPEQIDYRIVTPMGEIKFLHSRARLIKSDKGEPEMLLGIVQDVTSLKLMAVEVEQNTDRLQLALNASNLGVWEWNMSTGKVYYDDRCRDIVGIPDLKADSLEGLLAIAHPDDQPSFETDFRRSVEQQGKLNTDVRVLDSSGHIRHINIKADFGRSGSSSGIMYGVLRDMTRRKKAEQKVAENEQIFRQLAENITEVFYLTDIPTNTVLFISDTYEEVYGSPVEELYEDSKSWSKRIHPEDKDRVVALYTETARSGNYDIQYRIVLDTGEIRWVHDRAFPIFDGNGTVTRIAGLAEDVTQRMADEQQIKMLSQVASETVNGVLIQDKEGKIEWMNDAFYTITGYQGESVIGKEPWSFLSGPDTDQNLVKLTYESMKRKKPFQSENKLYRPDGSKVWVSVNFTPILDSNGDLSRIVSIGMDITHIKEQEDRHRRDLEILEEKVSERTALLESANLKLLDEIKAREELSSQLMSNNNDLMDSLGYAKQIQKAILPDKSIVLSKFDKAFILARPKNVVSGDFHWFHQTSTHTMIAAVDCTGHSVPGALMSMVGNMLLDQAAVSDHGHDPGKILARLDELVRKNLDQNEQQGSVKDGMDIGLCVIDNETLAMQYSGAMNAVFHVYGASVSVINGTRTNVGGPLIGNRERIFDTHSAQLKKGDKLYLTTDGYYDQFGGPSGKKFMKRRFQQLIQNLQSFDFDDHKQKLASEFEAWKGDLTQVDDVLVVGIRI